MYSILTHSRFLLDEAARLQNNGGYESPWIKPRSGENIVASHPQPYMLSASAIYLFVSGTPCGDASLDLLAEDPLNAVPWTMRVEDEGNVHFHGHEYIWERGKVRFKPGMAVQKHSHNQVAQIHLIRIPKRVPTSWHWPLVNRYSILSSPASSTLHHAISTR